MRIVLLAILQSLLLVAGQVFLKSALARMLPFAWTADFWRSVWLNWRFAVCGLAFGVSSILWMHIIKHYPLSTAYPMISLSYVLGMVAAITIFHEDVSTTKWIGAALIVGGCCLIAK